MSHRDHRPRVALRPEAQQVEGRTLLSLANPILRAEMATGPHFHLVRPNTPVAPFGAVTAAASFIDPSSRIVHGDHIVIGQQSYVAPYVLLDASGAGFIKIGSASSVLDNAQVVADAAGSPAQTLVFIGDQTAIGYGATILGPSTIGAVGTSARPTYVGANAQVDGATIEPGAIVGDLARVGPGVTIPSGYMVLPGMNVTTQVQASNPALGMVAPTTVLDRTRVLQLLTNDVSLAAGYTSLYQGNSATGVSPGAATSGVYNGDLAAVEGASKEPGPTTGPKVEPGQFGPRFAFPGAGLYEADIVSFPARVVGLSIYGVRPRLVALGLQKHVSIRADQGQPINVANGPIVGAGATITSPVQNALNIGKNLVLGQGAVLLGGPLTSASATVNLGSNDTIGPGAVVTRSSLGDNVTIGARAYVADSSLPSGTNIPDGAIVEGGKIVGQVQW